MSPIIYPYKSNSKTGLYTFFMCLPGAVVFGYFALTNTDSWKVMHMIELNPGQTKVFFWLLAALAGTFSLIGLGMFISGFTSKRELAISETEISISAGLFSKREAVPFAAVKQVTMQGAGANKILLLHHGSTPFYIFCDMLPSEQVFFQIIELIGKRTGIERFS